MFLVKLTWSLAEVGLLGVFVDGGSGSGQQQSAVTVIRRELEGVIRFLVLGFDDVLQVLLLLRQQKLAGRHIGARIAVRKRSALRVKRPAAVRGAVVRPVMKRIG